MLEPRERRRRRPQRRFMDVVKEDIEMVIVIDEKAGERVR